MEDSLTRTPKRAKAKQTQMTTPPPNKKQNTTTDFLQIAPILLPWLTPLELSLLSSTSSPLHSLTSKLTTLRTLDATQSLEPHPIPFTSSHPSSPPYSYFLYTPTLITHPSFTRQPWPHNNTQVRHFNGFSHLGFVHEAKGCACGEVCDGCCCFGLRFNGLMSECGPVCECGLGCGNRVTQRGVSFKLKIVWVGVGGGNGNKGWGLFADQLVPSGSFLCEYAGELLTTKEARRRQQTYDELAKGGRFSSALLVIREHLPSGKACFRINIDATKIGNVGRFINHSCDGGNLTTVLVRSSGAVLPRVCFFASRDIQAGEELSFSYGDVSLRPDGLRCFCGSSCCRGFLPSEDT